MDNKEIIRKADGGAFSNKGSLSALLQNKKIAEKYDIVEEGDGFIAVPKDAVDVVEQPTKKKPSLTKCRVHRSNVDPDNKDMLISINVNSPANKKVFWPNEEVELTDAQVDVLRNSIEEVRLQIPAESGIYSSKDPIGVARGYYPNMQPEVDPATNLITMVSRVPNFILELVV